MPFLARKNNSGFTLVELLIVIAIIGMFSTFVLSSLNSARAKARDTKRISDLRQIKLALEQYRNDNGGYPVPVVTGAWASSHPSDQDPDGTFWDNLETALSPYINELPRDPKGPAGNDGPWDADGQNNYMYRSNMQVYDLVAQLEDPGNPNRCETKQYKFHVGSVPGFSPSGAAAESSWCGTFNILLYADH